MIQLSDIISRVETIEVQPEEAEGFSAYGVWKQTKEVFKAVGIEFNSTSQSFYNLAKSGKINGVKSTTQRFSEDEVIDFIAKLIKIEQMKQQ